MYVSYSTLIAKDLKQQRELRCEKLEKHYEEQLDVQTADYLKKMEVWVVWEPKSTLASF